MKENQSERRRNEEEGKQLLLDNIGEIGGTLAKNERENFQCITVIGQIEGHYALPEGQKATKYEHILPLLVSVEEDDEIAVRNNGNIVAVTYGGKNGVDSDPYKTFILNYNNYAVTVKYDVDGETRVYTIPANRYVMIQY